jgi:murein DD-endopeptidase MepM/ murein hydrolase activator NlpD
LKGKLIHRFALSIIVILLFSATAFSFPVRVTPGEVIPGDVFLIKTEIPDPGSVEADFRGEKIHFSQSGSGEAIALVPVDINTPPRKYTIGVRVGSAREDASIIVRPHTFKTIELTLPEGKVTLSPENQDRAVKEARLLKRIWLKNTSKKWNGGFINPTDTEISTEFGVKRIMNKKKTSIHRGIDFRGKKGTQIKAINAGTVVLTDDLFFGGNTLVVDHGMGLYSIYMHLSKFNAAAGDRVSGGEVIGFVGSSGRATGPHLHMSVKLNGLSVNPESLFRLEL